MLLQCQKVIMIIHIYFSVFHNLSPFLLFTYFCMIVYNYTFFVNKKIETVTLILQLFRLYNLFLAM